MSPSLNKKNSGGMVGNKREQDNIPHSIFSLLVN